MTTLGRRIEPKPPSTTAVASTYLSETVPYLLFSIPRQQSMLTVRKKHFPVHTVLVDNQSLQSKLDSTIEGRVFMH
ncbi:unnamed protein product [Thelazia callipaeda]|uniref:Uncharacterized protein n=1 Tax=Thelazia callipaeda TaxID=103827 RepID=A0A0N5CU55_THECL|nr:unnamed protein product [Thelazia callipaeda]